LFEFSLLQFALLCNLLLRGLDDKATGNLVRVVVNVFRKHDMKHAKQFAGYGDKRLHRFKRILRAVLAVEATGNARYFKNFMENEGFRGKIINTLKFKVVVESVNKTDKRDARVIATFLAKDFIPESHLCSQYEEDLRRLLKTRSQLVKTIVGLKNNIHGMMLSYGIVTKPSQFQSKKGRQQLRNELEAHTEFNVAAAGVLDCILKVLEDTSASLKEVEQELERYVEKDDAVAILRTIPGVGLVTSSTIRAWTADIDRF